MAVEEMSEWQKDLREALGSGLVAHSEDGRETQVSLDFDSRDGTLRLEWKDADDQQWHLTIPYATVMALTNAMVKRLYPRAKPRGRRKDTQAR
jgi:hypothetical protein